MSVIIYSALIWKFIDFLRMLTNLKTQTSAVITQATAWAGGIGMVALGAHAQATKLVVFPGTDTPLGKMDGWSIILFGLAASSLASALVDVKQSIDGSDSAAKPSLLNPPTITPTQKL